VENPDEVPEILKSLRKDFKLINSLLKEAEEQQDNERVTKFLIRWQAFRTRLLAAEERHNTPKSTRDVVYREFFESTYREPPCWYKNRRGSADRRYNGGFSE
jgi:hypothetical protein